MMCLDVLQFKYSLNKDTREFVHYSFTSMPFKSAQHQYEPAFRPKPQRDCQEAVLAVQDGKGATSFVMAYSLASTSDLFLQTQFMSNPVANKEATRLVRRYFRVSTARTGAGCT